VRFIVLTKPWPGLPALHAIAMGKGELAGFRRIADLPEDAVFERDR
jgi:hypothetical protein